jgi:hypothetical protein
LETKKFLLRLVEWAVGRGSIERVSLGRHKPLIRPCFYVLVFQVVCFLEFLGRKLFFIFVCVPHALPIAFFLIWSPWGNMWRMHRHGMKLFIL